MEFSSLLLQMLCFSRPVCPAWFRRFPAAGLDGHGSAMAGPAVGVLQGEDDGVRHRDDQDGTSEPETTDGRRPGIDAGKRLHNTVSTTILNLSV